MLETRDLAKTYETGEEALKGVDISVDEGDLLAIIGPSGAGKSTFLRCVNHLVIPTGGKVILDGLDITSLSKSELRAARRDMGMIFQEYNLIERLTTMENVLSGRLGYIPLWKAWLRKFPKEDTERAFQLLERVGLEDQINERADSLSGGQRQRVGIARALMQDPKILLVDEPTSSLDPETSHEVMGLVSEIAKNQGIPSMINIHEVPLAEQYANRIIGLREGEVVFRGTPNELDEDAKNLIYRGEELPGLEDKKSDGVTRKGDNNISTDEIRGGLDV